MKKKVYLFVLVVMSVFVTSCHNDIWNAINDLDSRVKALEELCKQMNTNITALQTIVSAMESNDCITAIVPIQKNGEVIGYTITFAKHEPITIYNGEDGKDGIDGGAPVIGVAKDSDGIYYWTLNGQWLFDADGNKLRVSGEDGRDGADGQDGTDGQDGRDGTDGTNGQDGVNGITPLLSIVDGYWYVSYDNGTTWTEVGQATGNDGQDGRDGQDGTSVFQNVTYDNDYVYFTLSDGTVIVVPRGENSNVDEYAVQIVDGAIMAAFSVSSTKQVYFSMGNLQYNAVLNNHLCIDSTYQTGTWRFAENQYDYISSSNNSRRSSSYNGWIDEFCIGHSGFNGYLPYIQSANGATTGNIDNTNYDWGVYNSISNGGNEPNKWRTLTYNEWQYLIYSRKNSDFLMGLDTILCQNGVSVEGLMLFPDNWVEQSIPAYKGKITFGQYQAMASHGAVFIPGTSCWTASKNSSLSSNSFYVLRFQRNYGVNFISLTGSTFLKVRLVKNVE